MNPRGQRTAVIVGAASGMGRACAARFGADGYRLILADLSTAALDSLARDLDGDACQVDVVSDEAVAALGRRCPEEVDALVITAGLSMSMAPFERVMNVNLGGTARLLREFHPRMKPGGAAVCLASIAGHLVGDVDPGIETLLSDPLAADFARRILDALPSEQRVSGMAYGLSKLGILRLVQRRGAEWGARGARICSISPGVIDTPMGALERKTSPQSEAAMTLAPIPRLGRAEEVANVAAFLCSSQASYITACDILVDGGWVGTIHASGPTSPFAQALASARNKN
jgi:NAD(P)-dependent dehydrogenase (short-subunit alcohol dehydrogenase family)